MNQNFLQRYTNYVQIWNVKQRQAYIFALLSVLCWSTVGSAFKISLRYIDFLNLLLLSSFTAFLVLGSTILIQRKMNLLRQISFQDILHSALLGFLNPFLYYVVLFKAYDLLWAQEAATLNYSWPIALVLLSIPMLKQKISFMSIMALIVSFAGIVIISTRGNLQDLNFSDPLGVSLALGSAVIWAIFWILNMKDHRDPVVKLFINFLFGFIYILITIAVRNDFAVIPWQGVAGSVYIGFLEMGITFVLWLKALTYSSTTAKVTNLIYLAPFLSLIFITIFVGETIYWSTVTGLVFLIGGILLQRSLKS